MNSKYYSQYNQIIQPVTSIKGVGPIISAGLSKRGIHTVFDLLCFIPRAYQDRRRCVPIGEIKSGEFHLTRGRITDIRRFGFKYRQIVEMKIVDESGVIFAKWKGTPQYLFRFRKGTNIIIFGRFREFKGMLETYHPEIITDEDKQETGRLLPVYPEIENVSQRRTRRIMLEAINQFVDGLEDPLPNEVRLSKKLLCLDEAVKEVHFPSESKIEDLRARRSMAQRRLIFDEFFLLQLALALKRNKNLRQEGIAFKAQNLEEIYNSLPFRLTDSQYRVVQEILRDMSKPFPMNRLLQGDVGCGKTVVALIVASVAANNGYQVAFMAPTQLLAEQHYLSTLELAQRMKLKPALLTSSMGNVAEGIRERVKQGDIDILIGTHALIQESVHFHKLGLVIIDEQHRFGVTQRTVLRQKGVNPDVLTMTATPIPRTLGLTLYGDLDLSVIETLPPGRKPIKTKLFHESDRSKVYEIIKEEIKKGRQVYMICPLIEESEKIDLMDVTQMAVKVKERLPELNIDLIHGRMPVEQRERVLSLFKEGLIDILVSTTVIEVGINIVNATIMVIENAERFGLSQIHQLRGRVGRSDYPSRCLLLASYRKTDEASRRLRVLENTTDGFRIAEQDLAIRGPGEFLGTRQSGLYQFKTANLMKDADILSEARQEAFGLVERDPELARRTYNILRRISRDSN